MKDIYLRHPEPRFVFWKWIVFGSLFLLAVDFASSLTDNIKVAALGIWLGFMITGRMVGLKKLSWVVKLLSGIGLSLLISSIASACLLGLCLLQTSSNNLCEPNNLRAYIFSNYSFPFIIVAIWVVFEILGAIGRTISYAIKHRKR